jgi:GT2 family glycosyltransferase
MDNSTRDCGNAAACAAQGWEYCPMGGNAGLPRAYNAALEKLQGFRGLLILLDDDTALNDEYFLALRSAAARRDADVYLPRVRDSRGLLSPCRIRGHRVRRLTDAACWRQEYTAINSGMALRHPIIGDLRWDEGYFLDYVDHAFVRSLKAAGARFRLFDAVLAQQFSDNLRGNGEQALVRFRIFIKDFLRFCADSACGRLYGRLYVMKRALLLCARHRCAAFFKS